MTSILKVDTIQNSTGTGALSIDGSGNVSAAGALNARGLSYWPAFVAGMSANPSNWFGYGSNDIIPFDTVGGTHGFDNGSDFNTSTSLYTAPVSGLYRFDFHVYTLESNTVSQFRFKVNSTYWGDFGQGDGSVNFTIQDSNTPDNSVTYNAIMNLTAGDTVGVYSVNNNSRVYSGSTYFMGHLVA